MSLKLYLPYFYCSCTKVDNICRFDATIKETVFSVGLRGISTDDVDKVISIIDETIDQVIKYDNS